MATKQVPLGSPGEPIGEKAIYESPTHHIDSTDKEFKRLPVDMLQPSIFQPRKNFNPKALQELASSLRASKINFSPLTVRPNKSGTGYEIICGERRWRAAQIAGYTELLCCVGDFTDQQCSFMAGEDNLKQVGLNTYEEALSYECMIASGLTQQEVATHSGKSRTYITHHLSFLKLPLACRDLLSQEKLTYAQARPLCRLTAPGHQIRIAKEAVAKKWSYRKIESEVNAILSPKLRSATQPLKTIDGAHLDRLKELVSQQTGYPCVIVQTGRGGWQLGLAASSTEEFQGILERLGVNTDEI